MSVKCRACLYLSQLEMGHVCNHQSSWVEGKTSHASHPRLSKQVSCVHACVRPHLLVLVLRVTDLWSWFHRCTEQENGGNISISIRHRNQAPFSLRFEVQSLSRIYCLVILRCVVPSVLNSFVKAGLLRALVSIRQRPTEGWRPKPRG